MFHGLRLVALLTTIVTPDEPTLNIAFGAEKLLH